MWYEKLAHLNAFLNATSAVLLALGYRAIRFRRDTRTHAQYMIAAFITSSLFLASYLTYHYNVLHRPYPGTGAIRAVYFTVLVSHIVLAVVTVPLVLVTISLAARRRFVGHRRIARWTFPIWAYVSVTGVIVYLMLYVF